MYINFLDIFVDGPGDREPTKFKNLVLTETYVCMYVCMYMSYVYILYIYIYAACFL